MAIIWKIFYRASRGEKNGWKRKEKKIEKFMDY